MAYSPLQYLWTHDLQVYVRESKRLACRVDFYGVSRCSTRGASQDHTDEKACKGSTRVLKSRADVTRSGLAKNCFLRKFQKKNYPLMISLSGIMSNHARLSF